MENSKVTRRNYKPVILITGCGSGLGLALATLLYPAQRYRVAITARSHSIAGLKERFKENSRFRIFTMDVTKEDDRKNVVGEIQACWGGVDILVNNAAVCYRSVLEHMSEDDERLQMATNYFGPIGLARLVLPRMRKLGRGKIINVSSVSGMLAMPTMSAYSASKHALEGASEALWYECRPLGVDVCLVQPGFIRSSSFEKVRYSQAAAEAEGSLRIYNDYYKSMSPFIAKLMAWSLTTPDDVAKTIIHVIREETPPLWIPATIDATLFYYIRRIFPRSLLLNVLFHLLPNSGKWGRAYSNRRAFSIYKWRRKVAMFFGIRIKPQQSTSKGIGELNPTIK